MARELAREPEKRSSASAGGGHSALHRQSGGPPSLKPANDVGSIQAEAPQRRRGQARLVALVAEDDHDQVAPRQLGTAVPTGRIEPPFEDVPRDLRGAGDLAVLESLGVGTDVDERGPRLGGLA